LKQAAKVAGIGYENAKIINKVFKNEGRDFRLTTKSKPGQTLSERMTREHNKRQRLLSSQKLDIDSNSGSGSSSEH
jgi:hypothetical protein